ncbi:hypothetical protein HD806DRAFT_219231 [Xylariaceae sp. AK1471]|nr:hypothetical protein HD806DRAFT_219231 [Xylariaceae sp. AK1471]
MDPASIVGTAGVALNLAGLVGKTIKLVSDACDRWGNADLYFLSLRTQLGALKSALISIQSWLDANPGSVHYLLEMELNSTMKCCETLVNEIAGRVRKVYASTADQTAIRDLNLKGKAKLVFSGASMEDVLRMVDRQTSSMALLLTACNCNTLMQQKSFVEAAGTQKALKQAKTETASLYGLRDADSHFSRATSRFTQASSNLSVIFGFDEELFSTKVYGLLHRASIKHSIRQRRAQNSNQGTRLSGRVDQNKLNLLVLGTQTA